MGINLRRTVNKDKLKAKFEAESQSGGQGPSDFLPYFKLKNKDSLTIRFLSDANPNNQDFFTYTEEVFNFNGKNMKFNGLAKDCPASKIANDYFAEAKALGEETPEGKEIREKALKFYKKRKFLANAYIVDAPEYFWGEAGLDPDKVEDRVKVVSLPKKVYELIKDTVMDEDFDEVEFYNFGDDVVNFKLTVKKNSGGYNDYSASKFEIRPKDLDVDDDEIDVIAENLKDLSTLFKAHSLDEFNEAIEIELNGEDDDDENDGDEPEPEPEAKKVTKKTVVDDDEDSEEEAPVAKKTTKKTPSKKIEEEEDTSTDDEDEDDSDITPSTDGKKDIKSLRSGILSKLKIQEDA